MMEKKNPERHFNSSATVRDVIIGMSDGLTVPFALAAGLSGAVTHSSIIVIAGLAEIVAGSISMGLGGYLAGKSDADHYYSEERLEYEEIKNTPELEKQEVSSILENDYGLSKEQALPILYTFEKNHTAWVKFMMRNELNLEEPKPGRAHTSGLTIAVSYIIGGVIPLSPYVFYSEPHKALIVSVIATIIALVVFGYIKSKRIGTDPLKGALQTAFIGSVAAGAAYFIARLIS